MHHYSRISKFQYFFLGKAMAKCYKDSDVLISTACEENRPNASRYKTTILKKSYMLHCMCVGVGHKRI